MQMQGALFSVATLSLYGKTLQAVKGKSSKRTQIELCNKFNDCIRKYCKGIFLFIHYWVKIMKTVYNGNIEHFYYKFYLRHFQKTPFQYGSCLSLYFHHTRQLLFLLISPTFHKNYPFNVWLSVLIFETHNNTYSVCTLNQAIIKIPNILTLNGCWFLDTLCLTIAYSPYYTRNLTPFLLIMEPSPLPSIVV